MQINFVLKYKSYFEKFLDSVVNHSITVRSSLHYSASSLSKYRVLCKNARSITYLLKTI